MSWFDALILGIIQGLTEFLPVSSSGHLEIGKVVMGVNAERSLVFTVVVHGATVLSTIFVFHSDLRRLIDGFFKFRWNSETRYIVRIFISMIPVLVVGLTLSDEVASFFDGDLLLVGSMLIITALFLTFSHYFKPREKEISYRDSFIIGIAQALAVMPGISRSGATIATGLMLRNRKADVARFSFLMVLIPIIGANLKDLAGTNPDNNDVGVTALVIGFIAAFVTGYIACRWMVDLVKKGKLIYFGVYCFLVGALSVVFHYIG